MDYARRVKLLTPQGRADLDAYIGARLDATRAARKINSQDGDRSIRPASLRINLNRLARRLGFTNLIDLLVWYELECKGAQSAQSWRAKLQPRFEQAPQNSDGLGFIQRILELTRQGSVRRLSQLTQESRLCERTINRRIGEFASEVNITYSLNWLLFIYAVHRALEERPELYHDV